VRLIRTIILIAFSGAMLCSDYAEAADSNDISAYYGFGEIEIIKLDWDIKDLRIADFDGDGRNDIAVVNNANARIELLIQKESIGPSEAATTVDPQDVDVNQIVPPTRFERQNIAVSQRIYSLACGDLNSDGMVDIAFYGGEPKGLYVMLQKTGKADSEKPKTLSWRAKKKIKIDDGMLTSNGLACADINNDDANDLILAGRDAVYIVLQKKDGSLSEPVKYPASAQILGVEVGDLNGDNINDLIIITNDSEKPIHVRFGLPTGQLGPERQFFIEKPFALDLANIDGSPGNKILTVDNTSGRLMCYKLAVEKEKDADWPILFYPLVSGEGSTERDLVTGDFDGDGLTDIIISDPGAAELIFYKQTPGTGLIEPVRFPAFSDITGLSAINTDGKGKNEIAVLSVKEKIIGKAEFQNDRLSFPQPIKLVGEPVAMDIADIDNDGEVDCLYVSRDANDVRTLRAVYNLNSAGGKEKKPAKKGLFGPVEKSGEAAPLLELKKLTSNPEGIKILDVDQDGLKDILIFVKYESPILVRQTRKKKFEIVDSPGSQASLIKDAGLRSIAVADVDGKKGEELLVAQKNFARSLVFAKGESWNIIDQYNAKSTENEISAVAAFYNIENDKTAGAGPDILLLDGQKGLLQMLKASEDKTYRVERELNVGKWNNATHLKMLFEPLTGGKTKSILIFDGEKFALVTPPGEGSLCQNLEQQFSYETKIKDGVYGNLTSGDINNDGRIDIVMVEYNQNHIELLTLDSQGKPVPAMRFKVFEQKSYRDSKSGSPPTVEPRELRIADVTGDGKGDLVIIIHDRIIIYPQD